MIFSTKQLHFLQYSLLLFCWLFTSNISAQEQQQDTTAAPPKISVEKLQEDLDFLKKALEEIHPGMYHFTDKATYNQLFDSTYHSLQFPLTRKEFRIKISPLILQLQCGHTRFLTSNKSSSKLAKKRFPLQLRQIEGKIVVNKNFGEDTTVLYRGVQIFAINQTPIDSILEVFYRQTTRGSDGDNKTGKTHYNIHSFSRRYAEWFGRPDSFQITYQSALTGVTKEVIVPALELETMLENYKEYYGKKPKNITMKWLNETTALLKIRAFVDRDFDYGLNFWGQIRVHFQEIKRKKAQNLVIDLRGNGGGALKNSFKLMQYVVEEPFSANRVLLAKASAKANVKFREKLMLGISFKRTDSTYISSKSFTKIRQPKRKLGFKGKIFLLIDGGSYSASALFAAHLHAKNRATIIGEESGGNYYLAFAGFWSVKSLPHSKIGMRIPLIRLEYNVDSDVPFNKGVPPHFTVQQGYADFWEGKDSHLEKVKELIEW